MKLKRKIYLFKKNNHKVFFIFILILISIILSIKIVNKKASPILFDYAELESRKLASIIINNAIAKNVTQNINIDELFIITKDTNNEIKTIDFNPITVNKILTKVTNSIQTNLKYIEQGKVELLDLDLDKLIDYDINKLKKGIIYELPSGVIFGSNLLANVGPLIPIKFSLIGDIISYINTTVKDYGINSAIIEINIVLQLNEQVILPFSTSKIKIESKIPVAIKIIQGNVPNYYLNGINTNSSTLAIPIE